MAISDYDFYVNEYLVDGLTEVTGFDLPDINVTTTQRSGAHGMFTNARYLSGRTFTLTGRLLASVDTMPAAQFALKSAFSPVPADVPFTFKLPGYEMQTAWVKPQGVRYSLTNDSTSTGICEYVGTLIAGDPRMYGAALSASFAPSVSTGGVGFPISFPLQFSTASSGRSATLTNAGNFMAPTVTTFVGPLVNPGLANITTGVTMKLNFNITAGNFVEVDTYNRTVLYNGSVPRYDLPTNFSDYMELAPGGNQITGVSDSGSGYMQITWNNTWV